MDGLRCHLHSSTTLGNFWESKILCFQERAASSEALQPLDVSCYGPLSARIRAEASHYTVRFGVEKINQFEWPCISKIAKTVALTPENIKAGFQATGIWPRMTADEWLGRYGRKRGYTMINPKKLSDVRTFALKPTRLYEALDIATLRPKKRIAPTPLPAPRKIRKVAPKTTLDGLPLAVAKILNDPGGISRLRAAERLREQQFEKLQKKRAERVEAKRKRLEDDQKKKMIREKKAESLAHITRILKMKYGEDTKFS